MGCAKSRQPIQKEDNQKDIKTIKRKRNRNINNGKQVDLFGSDIKILQQIIKNSRKCQIDNQSKIKSLENKTKNELYKVIELDEDKGLQGIIRQQNNYSAIRIYNSKVYLQFTLPKTKAGPLIVPITNYSIYRL